MKTQSMFSFGLCLFGFVFIGLVSDAKITEKDIIAQWSFDESAADDVAIDMSGNGHDGTFDLGAKKTGAKFGNGAALDGKKGFPLSSNQRTTKVAFLESHPRTLAIHLCRKSHACYNFVPLSRASECP